MIYLLVGTNLGDRLENLQKAIDFIKNKVGEVHRISMIYETDPWGAHDQPLFYNQLLEISSSFSPEELLVELKKIEKEMGRVVNDRWKERLIDIDIIYYHDLLVELPHLTVPHEELPNRLFTLVPLCELIPDFIHPVLQVSNKILLDTCTDALLVRKIN